MTTCLFQTVLSLLRFDLVCPDALQTRWLSLGECHQNAHTEEHVEQMDCDDRFAGLGSDVVSLVKFSRDP